MRQLLIFCSLLFAISSFAQSLDQKRLKRDIEIAENIISTLFEQESGVAESSYVYTSASQVEGNYLDGYGIVFSTNQSSGFTIHTGKSKKNRVIVGRAPQVYIRQGSEVVIQDGQMTDEELQNQLDSIQSIRITKFKNVAQQFFTDYAYLIGQLQPAEKIMLRNDRKTSQLLNAPYFMDNNSASRQAISAEIAVQDLLDFRDGKISRAQLEQRIKFVETNAESDVSTDIKLLASVFERLYDRDLSQQFMRVGNCNYQVLEGLGAIYYLNFSEEIAFSNARPKVLVFGDRFEIENDGKVEVIVENENELDEPEPDEPEPDEDSDEEMYEDFINDFKRNIIEYGRMAKSLSDDELLIFRLRFNDLNCDDCLKNPELSVSAKVLKDFDANKISLAAATDQIKVSAK